MSRRFIILIIFALCACERGPTLGPADDNYLATASQTDCGFVQNSYGQRVSWKKNIPVTLKIHPTFPAEYEDTLKKAAQHWNDVAGMTLINFAMAEAGSPNKAEKNFISTVHWLQEWPEAQRNLQALTNLYWQGNALYESDVIVDAKYFNFFVDKPVNSNDIHLESLLIHELGHVLGLKHRSTVPSVMWATLQGSAVRSDLTDADRETIKCEY